MLRKMVACINVQLGIFMASDTAQLSSKCYVSIAHIVGEHCKPMVFTVIHLGMGSVHWSWLFDTYSREDNWLCKVFTNAMVNW